MAAAGQHEQRFEQAGGALTQAQVGARHGTGELSDEAVEPAGRGAALGRAQRLGRGEHDTGES